MAVAGAGRAVFFSESSRNIGGQELQLLQQAVLLQQQGWAPRILCRPGSRIAEEARARSLPVETLPLRNALDAVSAWRLLGLLRQHQPVALVCHSGHDANLCGATARAAIGLGLLRQRPALLRMRTYHPGRANAFTYNRIFDRTFTPSQALRLQLLANPAVDGTRVGVLYPGIDFDALHQRADASLPPAVAAFLDGGGPVVAHTAMLRGEKGHAFLLEVLAALVPRHPGLRYVAPGEGPLLAQLQARTRQLGLERHVLFPGMLQPVAPLLRRADVLVMPSTHEPLGMSQVEALSLGVPVVVSEVGGLPETVEDGVTGRLCPPPGAPDAPRAWAEALEQVFTQPALARQQARAGAERVRRTFDPQHNLRLLIAAWESVPTR